MKTEQAEAIALKALGWLVADEELLPVFLGASGASSEDLRAGAGAPDFLGSVLDFVLMDDEWVRRFCDAEGLRYELPMQARQCLPGGQQVHWT